MEAWRCRSRYSEDGDSSLGGGSPQQGRGSLVFIDLFDEPIHVLEQGGKCSPLGDGLGGIAAMPQGMAIAPWCAGRLAAVHPAASVRHRGRLAGRPGPRPGSATRAQVHGQSALHGVDPPILRDPHPPEAPRRPQAPAHPHERGRARRLPFAGLCFATEVRMVSGQQTTIRLAERGTKLSNGLWARVPPCPLRSDNQS